MTASSSRAMSAIPNEEQPILESLINIRNRLTALKKDSSTYVKPQDVQQLYQAVIKQVTRLNAVRDELAANDASNDASSRPPRPGAEPTGEPDASLLTETNRVDTTLNDVFSLLSLFFLTIGKSRETPATFCQLGSMKQLLGHLAESGIYTEADLQPFSQRLSELRAIIKRDAEQGKHPTQLTKLMMKKIDGCEKVLRTLEGTLSVLSVELVPIHQRLIHIRRQLIAAAAKPKLSKHEIKHEIRTLQEELRKIDGKRVDGKFLGPGGSSVPAGQAILVGILEDCFEIVHDINVRNDEVPMTLQPIYDRLSEIRSQLEHLVLTHRWTLRETDLWNYQVTLKEIDRLRVDGKFVDSEGKQPEGQLVVLYLLRRCYGLIYRLIASSEPISEELMPISNKLSTVSKCLKEVSKYGGPFTMRDLYPYRLALHQIDALRSPVSDKDGNDTGVRKWLGRDGSVPEGQAILRAQYEEVEQTINEMLNRDDDEDDDDEEVEDGDYDGSSNAEFSSGDDDDDDDDDDEHDDDDDQEDDGETESPADSAHGRTSSAMADTSFPGSPVDELAQDRVMNPINRVAATPPIPLSTPPARSSGSTSQLRERTPSLAMPERDVASGPLLPAGAAPLAMPQPEMTVPSPSNVGIVPGMTAVAGQPAVESSMAQSSTSPPTQAQSSALYQLPAGESNGIQETLAPAKGSTQSLSLPSSAAASAPASDSASLATSESHSPPANGTLPLQPPQPVSSIEALVAHVAGGMGFGDSPSQQASKPHDG